MAAAVFTPAHKVVIDAAMFLVARLQASCQDCYTDLAFKALGDVLPGLTPSGNRAIDALVDAVRAARELWLSDAKRDWSHSWLILKSGLADAVAEFAYGRLVQSHHVLFPEGVAS